MKKGYLFVKDGERNALIIRNPISLTEALNRYFDLFNCDKEYEKELRVFSIASNGCCQESDETGTVIDSYGSVDELIERLVPEDMRETIYFLPKEVTKVELADGTILEVA